MRIIRNQRRIRIGRTIGRYVPWIAIITLAAGLIVSWVRPELVVLMIASVGLGVLLSVVGGYFSERYAGPLAHHDALAKALKGLDHRHMLAQYVLPVPHVLLDPSGCLVFVVKAHSGEVSYLDGRWKHRMKGKFFRQLAGQESLGLPHAEAENAVRKLERWLAGAFPGIAVPIQGAVVFVSPNVTLNTDASPVPVMHSKKIKAWLRGLAGRKPMPVDMYKQLAAAFETRGREQREDEAK